MNWVILNDNQQMISQLFDSALLQATIHHLIGLGYVILLWTDSTIDEIELGDELCIRLSHWIHPSWSQVFRVSWKDAGDEIELRKELDTIA